MKGIKKPKLCKPDFKIKLDKKQIKELVSQIRKREVFEPLILVSLLILVLIGIIGFSIFEASTEKSKETNNAKMISELGDINSYLNELDESITNNKETLESVTNNSSETLQEELFDSTEEINLTIDENVTQLNTKMENLHNKIVETEANISNLLAFLGVEVEENQKEINGQFSAIKNSLEEIKQEFTDMIDEVKEMIEELSKSQEANHLELKETLSVMATDMETTATENLDKMIETLTSMEETHTTLLKDYHADTIKNISDLNENMESHFTAANENINNQFLSSNQSMEHHFSKTNECITNHYTDLTVLMTENDNDMSAYLDNIFGNICQKLDSVFTFVSDGKKKLASALLTKGVDCAEDATFEEIKQAILSINQQLYLGTETEYVYGDIALEHHYHVNGLGEYPHTAYVDVEAGGGCFTSPQYHTHVNACYKVCTGVLVSDGSEEYCDRCDYCRECPGGCEDEDGTCKTRYFGRCNSCGRRTSYSSYTKWKNAKGSTCGVSTLICGKNASTIDYYNASCGLLDGQIIAAHIVYTGYDDLPTANTVPATASFSLSDEAEMYESESESISDPEPTQEPELESASDVESTLEEETEPITESESISDESADEPESADKTESIDESEINTEQEEEPDNEVYIEASSEEIVQEETIEESEYEEIESNESSGYE